MTFVVRITEEARNQLEEQARWWAENRSVEQAARWYDGFLQAIRQLDRMSESHSLANENDDFPYEIRQLLYGTSSRPTHRAVFTVQNGTVIVLSVRHGSQDRIKTEDVPEF